LDVGLKSAFSANFLNVPAYPRADADERDTSSDACAKGKCEPLKAFFAR
jgi:hypothetical protein